MREQTRILNDRKRYNIQIAISKNAHPILSFSPLIMNLLPSRKVILVPVRVTL
jgi:hypothetical protein